MLKLGDFGFARMMERDALSQTYCGSTTYCAPEVLTAAEDYDPYSSDIWSCGIVLYAMLTAKLPFSRDKLLEITKCQAVEGISI